jgi:hypothetical protein
VRRLNAAARVLVLAALAAGRAAALGAVDKGTAGAAFLTLTPGARAEAMGGAFGGVADDALAAHYNPAGLGFLDKAEAAAGREDRFQGLSYDYAILSVPVLSWTDRPLHPARWGVTSAAVYSLSATGIDSRGATETDAPTGSVNAADRSFDVSYGLDLGGGLAVGGTLKYVDETLASAVGHAFTGDAGVLYKRGTWSFGGGLRDAFGNLALGSTPDPLPAAAYAGAGWRPRPGWLLAAEVDQPRADATALAFGAERSVPIMKDLSAAARAGYRTDRLDSGPLGGASLGFGVDWKGFAAEFSWSPGGTLGDVFQYSVRSRF